MNRFFPSFFGVMLLGMGLLLSTACSSNKQEDPAPNGDLQGTMSWTLDSVTYTNVNATGSISTTSYGMDISLKGLHTSGSTTDLVQFSLRHLSPGVLSAAPATIGMGLGGTKGSPFPFTTSAGYSRDENFQSTMYFYTPSVEVPTGTFTIEASDKKARTLAGTFEFTGNRGVGRGGVTNGHFDLHY